MQGCQLERRSLGTVLPLLLLAVNVASPALAIAESVYPRDCTAHRPANTEDADLLAPFYPAEAKAAGQEGSATLLCGFAEHSRLVNCTVDVEEPSGYGFGAAALKLAAATHDNMRTRYGPIALTARLPVKFTFTRSAPYISPDIFSQTWGQPTVLSSPKWAKQPSAEELLSAYPHHFLGGNPPGRVVLHCAVGLEGEASCDVQSEYPPDRGFGAAALKLSHTFRFTPMTIDGEPCAGGNVDVPINFVVPG